MWGTDSTELILMEEKSLGMTTREFEGIHGSEKRKLGGVGDTQGCALPVTRSAAHYSVERFVLMLKQ